MLDLFLEALGDSLKVIPFLLLIYIGIELLEYRFGNKIRQKVQAAGSAGPVLGALAGTLPQCGFSVISTALYTQRLITIGTLMAVYLATSDEAIPIILAQPDKISVLWPLILTKIIIAIIFGYGLDLVFRRRRREVLAHAKAYASGENIPEHHHETIVEEQACCGHSPSCSAKRFSSREIIIHPLIHTLKIFLFIFLISLALNFLIFFIGEDSLTRFLETKTLLQPFLAALIGLIPNCAASVVITELYLQGIISYGAVIAGLSAGGGLGILVLFREEKVRKNIWLIISLLFAISAASGLVIELFGLK